MPSEEAFSNPLAPPGETTTAPEETPMRLTNADFRKLMMTPRAPSSGKHDTSETPGVSSTRSEPSKERRDNKDDVRAAERRKKKSYYAKIKKEEEEKMAELAEKYRDRARERRDGKNPDYQAEDPNQAGMGGYRAVAPDLKSGLDAAERRKQMIQESKFLGGDMEHTHLVKGLDYALLQKVRSEIHLKEAEMTEYSRLPPASDPNVEPAAGVEQVEPAPPVSAATPARAPATPAPIKEKKTQPEEEEIMFKSNAGRRLYNAITNANSCPEFNDLFLPGRMAYAIDLDDDATESDIPTTVIRSKADLQGIENMQATFTTNDIVIQKLTQILSYLRTGKANKKGKKKDKGKNDNIGKGTLEDSIYPELGDYAPAKVNDKDKERERERERGRGDREKDKDRRDRDYRDKERDRDRVRDRTDRENERDGKRKSYFENSVHEEVAKEMSAAEERLQSEWPTGADIMMADNQVNQQQLQLAGQNLAGPQKGSSKFYDDDYYTECYPGMAEMQDAIDDSDDEADYTKMDMGNKKGPVGRWDFDTQEEYSDYMNQREAMPKAAFQYGVKMADGRKTRRIGGNKEKDRNAELNREWQQIQQILKRRGDKEGGGSSEKSARYEY